jgi:hypothetical protein
MNGNNTQPIIENFYNWIINNIKEGKTILELGNDKMV